MENRHLKRIVTDSGDLVLDPACVRSGTKVYVLTEPTEHVPSPCTGRDRVGILNAQEKIPPQSPRMRGEEIQLQNAMVTLKAIEAIAPGEFVLSHDGLPHRVLRTIQKVHSGKIIGLQHERSDSTLWLTFDHRIWVRRRPRSLGGRSDWSGIPRINFKRSTEMRNRQTPPEKIVWNIVRNNALGVKFRRQHPIGPYIADFYSRDARLVVEVDGKAAHASETAIHHDAARDALMKTMGLTVLRIPAKTIFEDTENAYRAIKKAVNQSYIPEETEWIEALRIRKNDVVFFGSELGGVHITEIYEQNNEESVYDFEVEGAHSFVTEVCVVHSKSSGSSAS